MEFSGAAVRALILTLAMTLVLSACGSLPSGVERAESRALPPSQQSALVRLAEASIPSPELSGFRLLPEGSYSLDARMQLARRAQRSLDVQYYHLHNDSTGRLLLSAIRDAALRGVRVRLLVDDLYTIGGDELFIGLAAFPNVEVRLFNPFCCGRGSLLGKYTTSLLEFGRLNHRMHNKLFIADSAVVVAGGRNIADEYFLRHSMDNFVDIDALIVGALVRDLSAIFDTYWNSPVVYPAGSIIVATGDQAELKQRFNAIVDPVLAEPWPPLPPIDILGYGPIHEDIESGQLGLIWCKASAFADSPMKVTAKSDEEALEMSVRMSVMDRVIASSEEVVLVSPYFIPGAKGLTAFGDLRKRGVKITVLTNSLGSNDEPLVHTGYARYRVPLLKSGVDLYEISPTGVRDNKRLMFPGMSLGRLHAKTAVIDRKLVFVGSMNLDPRSASKNTELGILAESPELAREVLRIIHISKLQSTYRLRLNETTGSIQWLTMTDQAEMVLDTEPETNLYQRVKHWLLSPFVPENQL
jgi:putative cardiolipin synthase